MPDDITKVRVGIGIGCNQVVLGGWTADEMGMFWGGGVALQSRNCDKARTKHGQEKSPKEAGHDSQTHCWSITGTSGSYLKEFFRRAPLFHVHLKAAIQKVSKYGWKLFWILQLWSPVGSNEIQSLQRTHKVNPTDLGGGGGQIKRKTWEQPRQSLLCGTGWSKCA